MNISFTQSWVHQLLSSILLQAMVLRFMFDQHDQVNQYPMGCI